MALKDDLSAAIEDTLKHEWKARDGRVVPTTESIASNGGRVDMTAAMLYADLANSTTIATAQPLPAARLFKAYLGASRDGEGDAPPNPHPMRCDAPAPERRRGGAQAQLRGCFACR